MEGWIRNLLLSFTASLLAITFSPLHASNLVDEQVNKPIIQPEIKRMDFEESRIRSDNYEIIASVGILSIEDFGVNPVIGAKLAYRVSEGFFVDVEYGVSTAGESSVESLFGGTVLNDDEKELNYLLFNLGYDLFPGEAFITDTVTYNTALYVMAGAGITEFAGRDNFTISLGIGYRVLISNSIAMYIDVRDHTFNMEILSDKKLTNNLETSFGLGFYF